MIIFATISWIYITYKVCSELGGELASASWYGCGKVLVWHIRWETKINKTQTKTEGNIPVGILPHTHTHTHTHRHTHTHYSAYSMWMEIWPHGL